MNKPLVSVCIPCFNAEKYVAAAIESVLSQTYPSIEIVAVNDGSRDSTGEILDSFARNAGIKVIHQTNHGQSAAANTAFRNSTGELVKFFDADDLLSPDLIEKQVARLEGTVDCVASAQWARFFQNPEEAVFKPEPVWRDLAPIEWLLGSLNDGQQMMQCALWLIPRPILDRSGLWNERTSLINDFEFIPRVLLASRGIRFTDGKLYYRSGIEGSLSGQKSRKAYESATFAVESFCRTVTSFEDTPRTRSMCADVCQAYYYEIGAFEEDLGARLKTLSKQLGGSQVGPSGGPVFRALSSVVGWKRATRLKALAREHGYVKLRACLSGRQRRSGSR